MGEHPSQWDQGGSHSQAWSSCLWTEQCDNFFPPKDRLNYMLNGINDDTNSQQGQGTTTKIMQQFTSCPDPSGVIFMRSESSAGESPRTSAPLFAILPFSLNFIIFTSFVQVVLLSLKVRVINVITCLSKSYQIWKFILWVKEGNTVCENIYWQLRGIKRLSLSLPRTAVQCYSGLDRCQDFHCGGVHLLPSGAEVFVWLGLRSKRWQSAQPHFSDSLYWECLLQPETDYSAPVRLSHIVAEDLVTLETRDRCPPHNEVEGEEVTLEIEDQCPPCPGHCQESHWCPCTQPLDLQSWPTQSQLLQEHYPSLLACFALLHCQKHIWARGKVNKIS